MEYVLPYTLLFIIYSKAFEGRRDVTVNVNFKRSVACHYTL